MDSLKREWAVHNAFHALGMVRKQSADTDLNWPQPWLIRSEAIDPFGPETIIW